MHQPCIQSIIRYYAAAKGDPNETTTLKIAPTGMAAYQIGGNTIHCGLHIGINHDDLTALTADEQNTL